jgi:hypothetical protein
MSSASYTQGHSSHLPILTLRFCCYALGPVLTFIEPQGASHGELNQPPSQYLIGLICTDTPAISDESLVWRRQTN